MKINGENKLPIKMWLDDLEPSAMAQARNLANLPFAFKHVAIMPDSHMGYGMPIGGVLATKDVIIPNAVGVDIGCGMCAVKTSLTEIDTNVLKEIVGEIRKVVPVGFNKHKEVQNELLMPNKGDDKELFITSIQFEKAKKSLGTLGGGNHFIEIQKGDDGHIWIMIHSGSRNLGKQVADHYNEIAKTYNEAWYSSVDKKLDLAFLPIHSKDGQDYIREMNYCVEYALANRKLMMHRVKEVFQNIVDDKLGTPKDSSLSAVGFDDMINIAHNYARMENHFGENVMVHRKGATSAKKGEIGIIPGSQGTKSYIVEGKGEKESFESCSHGAGRKMGRRQAERTLSLEDETRKLDEMGVLHAIRGKKDLDEAPGAYKDIDTVMENQKDLVEIKVELTPLAVIKG